MFGAASGGGLLMVREPLVARAEKRLVVPSGSWQASGGVRAVSCRSRPGESLFYSREWLL